MRNIPELEVQPTLLVDAATFRESRFDRDFSQVPVSTGEMPWVQPKLTIGAVGDRYEQEADRVASLVVGQIHAPATSQSTQGQAVQRQEENDPVLQAKLTIQGRGAIAGGEASTNLESAINRFRGGGQPLEAGLQQSMGQAMGADFSGVRVHTDATSDRLNQSIQAKAFTTGQDVFFRQGAYEPRSRGGQELIAHELTHLVQQNGGSVMRLVQKADNGNAQPAPEVVPPYTVIRSDSGQLSGGGAIWEHIDFQDGTRISTKKKPETGRFVYLDYRSGPFAGVGFSVYDAGYKAQEVRNWIRLTHGIDCENYWRADRSHVA